MRYITGRHTLLLLLTVALTLLTSCSDDADTHRRQVRMELRPYAWAYDEVGQPTATRGDDPEPWDPTPLGYYLFSDLYDLFPNQTNLLTENTISVYFTHGKEDDEGAIADGQFICVPAEEKWYASFDLPESGATHYLYGFIPYMRGVSATLTAKTKDGVKNFSNGTTMVISGLPSVTVTDVCAVVGVQKGLNVAPDHDADAGGNRLRMGKFDYTLGGENDPNHIFLLFDHLYSALRLKLRVDAKYDKLRTIRLKSLKLIAYNGNTAFKSKTTATIELHPTENGNTSPIGSISFVPDGSSPDMTSESLFKPAEGQDGINLTTEYTDFRGCFVPFGSPDFTIESIYDVYDKNKSDDFPNGNLIRQNCKAQNKIDLDRIFLESESVRGKMYTLNMTVNPTYLYMLSEPDLDNPTITLSNE